MSCHYPKTDEDRRLELQHKVRANAQRLEAGGDLLDAILLEALEELRADLDALEQG